MATLRPKYLLYGYMEPLGNLQDANRQITATEQQFHAAGLSLVGLGSAFLDAPLKLLLFFVIAPVF